MPGELPPTSAYTYAVEPECRRGRGGRGDGGRPSTGRSRSTSRTSWISRSATSSRPATTTASGACGSPRTNGRVIEILAIADGLADLDVNGGGQPADATALAALGSPTRERAEPGGPIRARPEPLAGAHHPLLAVGLQLARDRLPDDAGGPDGGHPEATRRVGRPRH